MQTQPLVAKVAAIVAGVLTLVFAAAPAGGQTQGLPLAHVSDIRLPGRSNRFDYQSVDADGRRLYVAHLGDSTLEVIDLDTLSVSVTVPGITDVHGVLAAPQIGRVFASATGTNELVTLDASTNQLIGRTPTGDFPDGIAYDSRNDLVLVSNKNAGSATVLEGTDGRLVRTVQLGREVGNVAYDSAGGLVYAAARPPDQLVAFDPTTGTITARIPVTNCDGAHGVYVQAQTQLAFVACENNAKLVTIDLRRQRPVAVNTVGANPDVLAYDPGFERLYIAAESGIVSVFSTTGRRPYKLGQGHLADGAHSVAVDPVTHLVFFPLARDPHQPGLRIMKPRTARQ